MTRIHVEAYRLTGGRFGGGIPGPGGHNNPVLLLSTIGRTTGKVRTVPLLYLADGENYIVVASGGGPDRDPPWVGNLLATGRAEIQVGGERRTVQATRASGPDRVRLWPRLVAMYGRWGEMQQSTTRELAVLILSPVDAITHGGNGNSWGKE
jgi:deazaflavin-dependent oxidoreductase (nitroreductase family)